MRPAKRNPSLDLADLLRRARAGDAEAKRQYIDAMFPVRPGERMSARLSRLVRKVAERAIEGA